jgi:hypothetical protein
MNQNLITLLNSLIGASITMDTNNNYVVSVPGGTTTTVSPSDIQEAMNALVAYVSATRDSLQTTPSAAVLSAFMQTIESI